VVECGRAFLRWLIDSSSDHFQEQVGIPVRPGREPEAEGSVQREDHEEDEAETADGAEKERYDLSACAKAVGESRR
jgi:hypothetical protein